MSMYFRAIKRVIIAGSRDVHVGEAHGAIAIEMDTVYPDCTTILCGEARGVDRLGEEWALERGDIAIEYYPADWENDGKAAGYQRNHRMAMNADALLAVWDGESKGTKHMIDCALKQGLEVRVVYV